MAKKVIAVVAVVVAAAMWTAAVSAQRPGGAGQGFGLRGGGQGQGLGLRGPGGPGGRMGGPAAMLAGLNLTDDQKAKVKELFESEKTTAQQSRQAIGELRQQLHAAIFAATADQGALASLQAKIVAAEQQELQRHVQVQSTLAGILTPEQRAKLAERGPGRGGRMGRGGDR